MHFSHYLQVGYCFLVGIIDDSLALEGDENFLIMLRDPMIDGLVINRNVTNVTIIDDDGNTS